MGKIGKQKEQGAMADLESLPREFELSFKQKAQKKMSVKEHSTEYTGPKWAMGPQAECTKTGEQAESKSPGVAAREREGEPASNSILNSASNRFRKNWGHHGIINYHQSSVIVRNF